MSHRSSRSTLFPFASGLAAVIAISWAAAPASALAATGYAVTGGAVQAQEWWLGGLHVSQTWSTTEGAGITVAVLGTGVAAGHPDLAGSVTTGPDFTRSGRTAGSPFWGIDGTEVAGVIAGHGHGTGGEAGLLGVAPKAKILSVRVSLEYNDPLNSDAGIARRLPGAIAQGITYAVDHGAQVIDLPLDPGTAGLTGQGDPAAAGGSQAEQAAVSYALARNVVLVAPAGDDGNGPGLVNYPAAYPGVIAVGAVGRNGQVASFSGKRSYVSLAAPGVALAATIPPDDYAPVSSTSASSGIVAGVAALILARYPHLTAAQVTQALLGGATADRAAGTGHGIVDAARSVGLAAAAYSASRPRPAAAPSPPRPHKLVRTSTAAADRAGASAVAGSLVRYVVAGLGGLIVLLVLLLMVMRSRRERTRTAVAETGPARARSHGQHEQRRLEHRAAQAGAEHAQAPGRAQPAPPGPAWTAAGGWHGGGLGEMQPPQPVSPLSPAPAAQSRPVMAPPPKPARAAAGSSGPPWEPAPEPERAFGPLPVAASSAQPPDPGPGIRVPGDMPARPGVAPDAVMPGPFDVTASPDPDFPPRPAADEFSDFLGVPSRSSLPTRQNLGFAAAPMPVDYAPPQAPDFTVPSRAGGVVLSAENGAAGPARLAGPAAPSGRGVAPAKADPGYIWDLAATDVFPAAAEPASTPEAPGAVGKDDNPGAPGAD